MHSKTYSAFFTPRDKEPSLSSSEEKSSEFGWLEIKRTRKQKYEGKTEQVLCKIYFFLLQKVVSENKLPRVDYMILFCKENYKTKYLRLFTLFPNLITKESYNWWVIRRVWVANIRKLQENTVALCKMAALPSG